MALISSIKWLLVIDFANFRMQKLMRTIILKEARRNKWVTIVRERFVTIKVLNSFVLALRFRTFYLTSFALIRSLSLSQDLSLLWINHITNPLIINFLFMIIGWASPKMIKAFKGLCVSFLFEYIIL